MTGGQFDERNLRCHALIVGARAQAWTTEIVHIPALTADYKVTGEEILKVFRGFSITYIRDEKWIKFLTYSISNFLTHIE